ncbi:MAG: SMI1/KNR4 family protein [Verrucomicrobiota bacterium]
MELIPADAEFAQALLHPNWQLVEEHYGVTLPDSLKRFYADPNKVLQGEFDLETPREVEGGNRIHVQTFTRIDESSIEAFPGFERFLEIASDGGEGLYFFDPKDPEPEIYLFVMDGYDLHPTGLTLRQFLEGTRLEPDD